MIRAFFDTNVIVDWLARGEHEALMLGSGMVRHLSSVVEMELRSGATDERSRRAVERLVRVFVASGRRRAPTPSAWSKAGVVLRALRGGGREVRRASLVNDVLIALTAQAEGAALFTRDRSDFEAIRAVTRFDLRVVD